MQTLCTNNVAVPQGQIVYTGMLNHQGGYVTDCTVTRLALNKLGGIKFEHHALDLLL